MPFDGTAQRGYLGLDDALLDMVEFALDGGKQWCQRGLEIGDKRCLFGSALFVQHETGCFSVHVFRYLAQAIDRWRVRRGLAPLDLTDYYKIAAFNDGKDRSFEDIIAVIRNARELAQIDEYVRRMESRKLAVRRR